jgi:hypothetical protein
MLQQLLGVPRVSQPPASPVPQDRKSPAFPAGIPLAPYKASASRPHKFSLETSQLCARYSQERVPILRALKKTTKYITQQENIKSVRE